MLEAITALWTDQNLSQSTTKLCWEACARMMWQWPYKNLNRYNQKAGNYLNRNTGLTQQEMDLFYTTMGLRFLTGARGANLRHALTWTPVILIDINKASGHAMVAAGFNNGVNTVVNPWAVMSVDFDTGAESCAAGNLQRTAAQVEKPLENYIWYW